MLGEFACSGYLYGANIGWVHLGSGYPTNGVRYARREGKDLFDALTCIRHHTHLDAAGTKLHAGRERHLKSAADMQALFSNLPDVLEESAALASRLSFTLQDLGYTVTPVE